MCRGVAPPNPPPSRELAVPCACVLDPNVLLEIYSLHDVVGLFSRLHVRHGAETENVPEVGHRRTRMADSLVLAIARHELQSLCFVLVRRS